MANNNNNSNARVYGPKVHSLNAQLKLNNVKIAVLPPSKQCGELNNAKYQGWSLLLHLIRRTLFPFAICNTHASFVMQNINL